MARWFFNLNFKRILFSFFLVISTSAYAVEVGSDFRGNEIQDQNVGLSFYLKELDKQGLQKINRYIANGILNYSSKDFQQTFASYLAQPIPGLNPDQMFRLSAELAYGDFALEHKQVMPNWDHAIAAFTRKDGTDDSFKEVYEKLGKDDLAKTLWLGVHISSSPEEATVITVRAQQDPHINMRQLANYSLMQ